MLTISVSSENLLSQSVDCYAYIVEKNFDVAKLQDNLNSFIRALAASKPSTSKGKFIQKITITSTMGVGIPIAAEDVVKA